MLGWAKTSLDSILAKTSREDSFAGLLLIAQELHVIHASKYRIAVFKGGSTGTLIVELWVNFVKIFPQSIKPLQQPVEFIVNGSESLVQIPPMREPEHYGGNYNRSFHATFKH